MVLKKLSFCDAKIQESETAKTWQTKFQLFAKKVVDKIQGCAANEYGAIFKRET